MLILIICLVIALLSNKTKEGFWTYHTRGSTFPMDRAYTNNCGIGGIRKMNGRCYDNYMRHFTQPRWIAKEEIVPAYTPYFDYERFYPSGVLTHTTKPTLTLTLFSEKNLSTNSNCRISTTTPIAHFNILYYYTIYSSSPTPHL